MPTGDMEVDDRLASVTYVFVRAEISVTIFSLLLILPQNQTVCSSPPHKYVKLFASTKAAQGRCFCAHPYKLSLDEQEAVELQHVSLQASHLL